MTSLTTANLDSYRLIITRHECTEFLLCPKSGRCSLPNLEIFAKARAAEQLTEKIRADLGIRVFCRSVCEIPAGREKVSRAFYAVLEVIEYDGDRHAGYRWTPFDKCELAPLEVEEDRLSVADFLAEASSSRRKRPTGQFASAGWLSELLQWAQRQIEHLGLRITGGLRQLNASPTFSLVRIETTGPAIWFKATGEPNLHERPISLYLARHFPQYVPPILGVHEAWNGWLSQEVVGPTLDSLDDPCAWEKVAVEFSELQIATINKGLALLALGCQDRRYPVLIERIEPFLARMVEFMAAQEVRTPAPLAVSELSILSQRLHEACLTLEKSHFPNSLSQTDLNPGNVIISAGRCCFLDWASGCVSHPFIALEYLRAHARRHPLYQDKLDAAIVRAYLRPWKPLVSSQAVQDSTVVSPLIAVFVSAIACSTWQSLDPIQEPSLAGYFRGLTRRMYRESAYVFEGSQQCGSHGK
jgi:hypothetical protein